MNKNVLRVIIAAMACLALGTLSGLITISAIEGWYTTIRKPSWTPPNWIFGPVWSLLYILMGIALGLILNTRHPLKKKAVLIFIIQFILNLAWSFIFFYQQMIGLAVVDILFMLGSIILTIFYFNKINRVAASLLIPYLLWVSFASFLNLAIYLLNR